MAQTLTGSITGTVKDEQGAVLPGVTVTLTGKQGAQTQVTEASGSYRFPALEVGTYEVSAELSGFTKATQGNLQISPGRELTIDLQMKVGGLAENITVVGDTPVVDVKSSATETTISQSLLFSAPITRTAINVINYAPGINSSSAYGGGAGSGNALLIDGVDTRDPERRHRLDVLQLQHRRGVPVPGARRAGRIRRLSPARWSTPSPSPAATASPACSTSSAPREPRQQQHLGDDRAAEPEPGRSGEDQEVPDITTQFGGPIAAEQAVLLRQRAALPARDRSERAGHPRHEVSPRLNGKLTWQPNAQQQLHRPPPVRRLQHHRPRRRVGADRDRRPRPNQEDAPEYVWMAAVPAHLQLEHVHRGEVHRLVGLLRPEPEVDNVAGHFDGATVCAPGSQGWFYYADRDRDQVNASITHYADKFGRHELKFGAEFERSTTRDRYGYNDGFVLLRLRRRAVLRLQLRLRHQRENMRQSVFAQDAWHATNRLTVNVGVRGDIFQGNGKSGGNVYSSNNWAPRLGVALDVAGDNRTVLKGSTACTTKARRRSSSTGAAGQEDYVTYLVNCGRIDLEEVSDVQAVVALQGGRRHQASAGRRRRRWLRARAERDDATVADRRLARQQELRQLGRQSARWTPITLATRSSAIRRRSIAGTIGRIEHRIT